MFHLSTNTQLIALNLELISVTFFDFILFSIFIEQKLPKSKSFFKNFTRTIFS